jgi:LuxR family maltose regulon positive regulatory protein
MVVVDKAQFQSLPASVATVRAYHAQAIGDWPGTVRYTRRVLDLLPEEDHFMRGSATMLLGLALWASGDLEAADRTFSNGMASRQKAGHILYAINAAIVLADMKMVLGHLHEAIRTCEHALQLANEHGEPMPQGAEDVYTEISKLHREQGDLDAAAQDLATSKNLGEKVVLPDWQHRWCIAQARLKETLGDLDSALELLDEAERLFVRTPLPNLQPISALKARIWVAQGRLTEALGWAHERSLSVDDDLSYLREFEHIALARVLIARYKSDRVDDFIREAVDLLARLLIAAEEGGRMGSVIEILILQALAREAQGNIPPALMSLERALVLAEPEGYVRIFVDEGKPMAELLTRIGSNEGTLSVKEYVLKLLSAFDMHKGIYPSGSALPSTPAEQNKSLLIPKQAVCPQPLIESEVQPAKDILVEPLSERELEVLRLLRTDMTGPEIARECMVSLSTVRTHTQHIYSKLGVGNRRVAVHRAEELNLL